MTENTAPLIGITMRYDPASERFYLARMYAEAVRAAGGLPVHIPLIADADYIATLVERLDGVLLPGSASDVDPRLYSAQPHRRLGDVHTLRDETDARVLRAMEQRQMPLLAICYGLQMWNVSRGGTLIQDISSEVASAIKHEQGAPRERQSHDVRLASRSRLACYANINQEIGASAVTLKVNSHHHQAIEKIGRNLRAVAWSADGLVEALEDTNTQRWALGVQWHPEIAWQQDLVSSKLFAGFVQAANEFSRQPKKEQRTTPEYVR